MTRPRGRELTLWLASYLIVVVFMMGYYHAPLVPLLLGGLLTFLLLVIRWRFRRE